jgi:hypothetical protein
MAFFEGAPLICCLGNLEGPRDRKKYNNLIKVIGAGDHFPIAPKAGEIHLPGWIMLTVQQISSVMPSRS